MTILYVPLFSVCLMLISISFANIMHNNNYVYILLLIVVFIIVILFQIFPYKLYKRFSF